jgi:predicted branched-subunit amino acid permease
VLALTAAALLPWTLWLTYSLPSRHVTPHYDLAWVGFDVALLTAFVVTSVSALRSSQWLVPAAATTATMLLCDAWFDVVTSGASTERTEALLQAAFGELPLSAICWYVVYDAERFRSAAIVRYSTAVRRRRSSEE